MSQRGWYRVDWVTWLAGLLVAGALVYAQFLAQGPVYGTKHVGFGWPFVYVLKPVRTLVPPRADQWSQASLLLSVLCCLLIAASTVFVLQSRFMRSPRFQFTIAGLLTAVAVVAVVLVVVQERFAIHRALDLGTNFAPDWSTPGWCYARLPILFGLGCTIYAAGWLAVRLLSRVHQRLRSSQP
ncbi:MAG: hypothetical protein WD278_19565 [Pirellulales bacterium]